MASIIALHKDSKSILEETEEMLDLLSHRGKYVHSFFSKESLWISNQENYRLEIENKSKQKLVVFFVGRLTNEKELRKALDCQDSIEVLIQKMYEKYQEKLADHLEGYFAFIILDLVHRKLLIANDLFGSHPLYYSHNGEFIVATELKAIVKRSSYQAKFNKKPLRSYLTFQTAAMEETFFSGCFRFLAGHTMLYDLEKREILSYIDRREYRPSFIDWQEEELEAKILDTIKMAVSRDLTQDHAAFLSGGVDSSFITSLCKPKKTFTVGYKGYESSFDESDHSKALSDILSIDNACYYVGEEEFFEALPEIQYYADEPHANLSMISLYFLNRFVSSEGFQTVYSGEGADEAFGGYESYYETRAKKLYGILPKPLRKSLANLSKDWSYKRLRDHFYYGQYDFQDRFVGQAFIMELDEIDRLVKEEYRAYPSAMDLARSYYERFSDLPELSQKQLIDYYIWMPNDILPKADRMAARFGVDLRMPLMDQEVFDLSRTIKPSLLNKKGIPKYIYRKAAYKLLPEEWAKRKKLGFMVPLKFFLHKPEHMARFTDLFKKDFVGEFFNQDLLLAWSKEHLEKRAFHQRKLYTIYAFLLWYQEYFYM